MVDHVEAEDVLENLTVHFDDEPDLCRPDCGTQLLGFLISESVIGVNCVKAILQSLWQNLGQIRITGAKRNVYTITVASDRIAQRLVNGSPWNVKNHCFTVRIWPSHLSIDEIDLNRTTYWIQAHGIPQHQLKVENGWKLGRMIGNVVDVEDIDSVTNRGFLRMRIDFDARRPLSTFCWLPRSATHSSKIKFKYENLRNFCYKCGRLGHCEATCNRPINHSLIDLGVVYNAELIADPLHKPVYTLPNHGRSFRQTPVPEHGRGRGAHMRPDQTFKICIGERSAVNLTNDGLCTTSQSTPSSVFTDTMSPSLHVGLSNPTEPHHAWEFASHAHDFNNGNVTFALNGSTTGPNLWVDRSPFPVWALTRNNLSGQCGPSLQIMEVKEDSSAQLTPIVSAGKRILPQSILKLTTKKKRNWSSISPASGKPLRLSNRGRGGRRGRGRGVCGRNGQRRANMSSTVLEDSLIEVPINWGSLQGLKVWRI